MKSSLSVISQVVPLVLSLKSHLPWFVFAVCSTVIKKNQSILFKNYFRISKVPTAKYWAGQNVCAGFSVP